MKHIKLFETYAMGMGMGMGEGQNMQDIVSVAIGSKDHTTLVDAVKAADLVGTLQGKGPFTVFAPTNDAFGKIPAGAVADLLKPQNKGQLVDLLTYHVVPGKINAADLMDMIEDGMGEAVVPTVNGGELLASLEGGKVKLTDEKGKSAYVVAADLDGTNGVIHAIDSVLLPA